MNLTTLENTIEKFPNSPIMPVLFLGHGSPMNAIENNDFVNGFKEIAKQIPQPNAILCISAHWCTKGTWVTSAEKPKTIHDFYGFPPELYQFEYPAPGNPILAQEIQSFFRQENVLLDQHWGLDHGTWSVLTHLYPNANIPVIQWSLDIQKSPQAHFEMAKKLASFRKKGVLIVGSGNIIHNLGLLDFKNFHKENYGFDWAIETHELVEKNILDRNFDTLINYHLWPKSLQQSIPTTEHYLPFIYALGLSQNHENIDFYNHKLQAGSLSMTSLLIG